VIQKIGIEKYEKMEGTLTYKILHSDKLNFSKEEFEDDFDNITDVTDLVFLKQIQKQSKVFTDSYKFYIN